MRPTDVLERNTAALLARAYEAVVADPSFRDACERSFLEHHATRRTSPRAARPDARRSAPAWLPPLVALAAAVLAWFTVQLAFRGDAAPSVPSDGSTAPNVASATPDTTRVPDRPATSGDASVLDAVERDALAAAADGGAAATSGAVPSDEAAVLARIRLPEGIASDEGLTFTLLEVAEMPKVVDPLRLDAVRTDGGWRLDGLPTGRHTLYAGLPGSATWRTQLELVGGERLTVDVGLQRGVTARGRVLDAGGAPVANALVLSETDVPLQVISDDEQGLVDVGANFARTDAGGRFELGPLEPGVHALRATAEGHGPAWLEVALADEGVDAADLTLGTPGRITGRVTDALGLPFTDAIVIGSLFESEDGGAKRYFAMDIVDGEGSYALDDLPGGMFVVLIFDAESGVMRNMTPTGLPRGAERTLDFLGSTEASSLSGRLLDADGAPLAGWVVTIVLDGGKDSSSWNAATLDGEGRFRFDDLPAGSYGILTDAQGGLDMNLVGRVEIDEASDVTLDLTLPRGGFTARVVGPQGQPVPGFALLLSDDADSEFFGGRRQAGDDGRLAFEGLFPGRYRLAFFPLDGTVSMVVERELVIGAETLELDLELVEAGSLVVRLEAADGSPLPGVRLVPQDPSGRRVIDDGRFRTDEAGELSLTNLEPGLWTLLIERDEGPPLERGVLIEAGVEARQTLTLAAR